MRSIEKLTEKLPDSDGAKRFYEQLAEKFPFEVKKLSKNEGLLSDVLTVAAYSPLLATTILQNPQYISWLDRQRVSAKVRGKEELLESLARFALTNSGVETNVLLARFRRRELLRIYLRDIRGLGTIAEITEEISNLADAVLEYALRIARQELDNRFGAPLETDKKARAGQTEFCIVALGKLGSKELNYASDIDLLFIYSNDGATSGQGARGAITNREYFAKLAEFVTKIVGGNAGEGAAYRVDLRLRPHGRVGAPAISSNEAVNYYQNSAQAWERQVLIRSRTAAGEAKIYRKIFEAVKSNVFSSAETIENALRNVRLSKEKINLEKNTGKGFNVKSGKGGVREIEFIAQALQLAYAGRDQWLRAPHTLISLSRLADRKLLGETELNELSDAYSFLRCLEHRLQMENGLQIHIVPDAPEKRSLLASRMRLADLRTFNLALGKHTENVSRIYTRIFGQTEHENNRPETETARGRGKDDSTLPHIEQSKKLSLQIFSSLEKSNIKVDFNDSTFKTLELLAEISPHFAETILTNPALIKSLPDTERKFGETDYRQIFTTRIRETNDFAGELSVLRKTWSPLLLEIVVFDAFEKITRAEAKKAQTKLAEASVEAAIFITKREMERRFKVKTEDFPFAVLGLGKLGGGGMDYNSDLDLVLVYDDEITAEEKMRKGEKEKSGQESVFPSSSLLPVSSSIFYSRAAEIFVTALSSLTRDGHLYRVDLRLRPDGKNGATTVGKTSFLNYLEKRAAIWEWLAYVKLRAVGGDFGLARAVENEARKIIHQNALPADVSALKEETARVRERLEREKSIGYKNIETDIKFGAGGMLDVYFATRFLQLRRNVPDEGENRSTVFTLEKLRQKDALSKEDFQNFADGYEFLNELDHNLRLTVGRSTRVPLGNQKVLQIITDRMKLASIQQLLENLTFHRLNIRASFERVLKN
ncbi:MAG TPA: hypothetical protein VNI84_01530 [Pyrinomonadaceae bacterium]|nr:hypothetical protein [Pyrinomonadaceae bacterium]